MSLASGTCLGPYEILSALGAGGMGEVYRARDTNLGRQVAIKVLPDVFAQDSERLARFEREAKTLAALNHPNIAAIHGFEKSGGVQALVMELVEGEDLSQRIARGPIPLDEALPIARQIAEALEAAHEQGIIHRDLKPANIKVTPNGQVKVLDFGLAKLTDAPTGTPSSSPLSMSPTITSPAMMTGVGVLLGTAAYMSPEQAKGRPADKRSDIWAFGCVLYEMLTGKRPFDGEDVNDTLASILKTEPNWSALNNVSLPAAVSQLVRRCLEKDPKRRLQATGEARIAIEDMLSGTTAGAVPSDAQRLARWKAVIGGAAVLLAATVAALALTRTTRGAGPDAPRPVRFTIVGPPPQAVLNGTGERSIVISSDGSQVVFAGGSATESQLFARPIDQLDVVPLRRTAGARAPALSPDGRWIVFAAPPDLKKVPVGGGSPTTLCRCVFAGGGLRGVTWVSNDTIVFATNDPRTGLLSVSVNGGEPAVLTKPDATRNEQDHLFPVLLPGGRSLLFTITPNATIDNAQIAVLDLNTGQHKTLIRGGGQAEYVPTGHLVYADAGTLRAVRFDLRRLEVSGDAVPVLEQVLTTIGGSGLTGAAQFAISESGTLVYVPGNRSTIGTRSLVWIDRQGREQPLSAPPHLYGAVRLSPDGNRVAVDVREGNSDIWVWDFPRQTFTRLTLDPSADDNPIWTPDGRRIIFRSLRAGLPDVYSQPSDGTGMAERLTTHPNSLIPKSISPDGRRIVLLEQSGNGNDLQMLALEEKPRLIPLIQTSADETDGDISPDGRWIAFGSNESGRSEIYVRPFPDVGGGRWQVSTVGGATPIWAKSGRELFYIDGNGFMVTVPVETKAAFTAGIPATLFSVRAYSGTGKRYDVSPDGQHFLMVKENSSAAESATASIVVVQNWTEELKRLVPTN